MAYKIIQWATGPVGRASLHHILTNPEFELVGLWVHSPDKVGTDAGDIVSLPKSGILATDDKAALLALDADIVMYTPKLFLDPKEMDREVCEILRSGKDVVTTAGYWFPHLHGAEYVAELEAACQAGGSRLFGSGENPGFFFERMATSAAGLCADIDEVILYEYIDCSSHPSPTLVFDVVGFGKPVEDLEKGSAIAAALDRCYPETIALCAQMMNLSFDSIERESSFHRAAGDVEILTGTVKAGSVSGQAHRWSAIKDGKRILTIINTWFIEREIAGWDIQDGWRIEIEGKPSLRISIDAPVSIRDPHLKTFPDLNANPLDIITAMATLRAIPEVRAAGPGIFYPPAPFGSFRRQANSETETK